MRTLFLSIIGLTLCVATSCDVKLANQKQVAMVDSTLAALNETILALDTIDPNSFEQMSDKFKTLDAEIWTYYENGDTARYWKNEVSKLQLCIKSLARYAKHSNAILIELNAVKKQLETLKHDLEHDLVDKDKIDEYVATEINFTTSANTKASKHGGRALVCVRNYQTIIADANRILKTLKAQD